MSVFVSSLGIRKNELFNLNLKIFWFEILYTLTVFSSLENGEKNFQRLKEDVENKYTFKEKSKKSSPKIILETEKATSMIEKKQNVEKKTIPPVETVKNIKSKETDKPTILLNDKKKPTQVKEIPVVSPKTKKEINVSPLENIRKTKKKNN